MKKLMSVILSITMLLTISAGIDFSAFALTNGDTGVIGYDDEGESKVTYTFNNGTLTISGNGQSDSYDNYQYEEDEEGDYSPFYNDDTIKTVIINAGVTGLGSGTFKGCSGITKVSFPSGFYYLGSYCFSGCTALKNITIPSEVDDINDNTFEGCTGLTSITIPSNVSYIGSEAFKGCTKLAKVSLPKELSDIENDAFENTAVSNNASSWYNNALYIDNHLITSANDKNKLSGAYAIKNGTSVICEYALADCEKITSVSIPDSVTVIGYHAFYLCNGLTTVSIPKNVEYIGEEAFETRTYHYYNEESYITVPSKLKTVYLNSRKVDTESVMNLVDSMPEKSTLYAFTSFDLANYCAKNKVNFKLHVHSRAAFGVAAPATFNAAGKTKGYYCPLCGDIITPQTTIAKLGSAKLSKVKKGTKSFKATWKKVTGVDGYQIQYSTKKNMKKSKKATVKGVNKTSKTVNKLKKGQKYYVRIRAYKTINGKKQYSKWSAKKTVKVK